VFAGLATGLATLLSALPVGAAPPAPATPSAVAVAGGFTSLSPSRLLDTRSGLGAAKAVVAPGATVSLQVAGRGGVPGSGVSAVVLNVTVVTPVTSGFVTVYGDGSTRPAVSNLNFVKGQTVPNLVVAPVGPRGKVALYNGSAGSIQLLADVSGYHLSGAPTQAGAFGSLVPSRLLDTRTGVGAGKALVAAGATVHLQVAGRGAVPASGVSAVVLNVTVVTPVSAGFVTVYGDGSTRPLVSNLNFVKAQTVPNLVVAPVGANGRVALYNGSTGPLQLVADVSGYYRAGAPVQAGTFGSSAAPARVLDTRSGIGAPKLAVAGGGTVVLQVTGRGGIPASGVSAVVLNVTVAAPTALGFVTAFGDGKTRPWVSNVNFVKAQTVPNLVIAPVGANGRVALYNGSAGSIQLIADVSGYYRATAAVTAPAPVSGVTAATASTSITLTWVNPTSASLTGVMIRRSVGSTVPAGPTSGFLVADVAKPTTTFTDTGMVSGTKYTYALFAHDAAPTYAAGATASATTTSPPGPGPVTSVTATSDNTSVTVTWVNPASSSLTGVVIRRAVGATAPASANSGTLVTDVGTSTVAYSDAGRTAGTMYTYSLFAHDATPVYANGATVTATTTDVVVASMTGSVTDAGGTHSALDAVRVDVISLSSGYGFSTSTLTDGTWSVTGLPAGDYSVCFDAAEATGGSSDRAGYVDECYFNQPTVQTARPVTVTDGATRAGVDAALADVGTSFIR